VALVEDRLKKDPKAAARQARAERISGRHNALSDEWKKTLERQRSEKPIAQSVLAAEVWETIKTEDWILTNGNAHGWTRRLWKWMPERTCGGSGGAGLGYGYGASLGVALAHKGTGKVCVNLQSDGDFLMVPGGLYTAAHHRIPLLTVMVNNHSYYNDEEHQERMAIARKRPVENKGIGIRIDDPAPDFAKIAQGFGIYAEGPIDDPGAIQPAIKRALKVVKDGAPALVDVIVQPR
jgi:thiamine pyrophosphate-dependent acetolactate synthase large subunit-like protein